MFRKLGVVLASLLLGLSLAACGAGGGGGAENYPSDTITILVPYPAGGAVDIAARATATGLENQLDATVVVENKPGGAGSIAMNEVRTSNPDGHTLGMSATGPTVITPLINDVGYSKDDFTYVGAVRTTFELLVVRGDSPYDSVEQFVEAAKENPGQISVATPGAASVPNTLLKVWQKEYDVPIKPVPFDGAPEILPALLGGNVDAIFSPPLDPVLSSIETGELKALAHDSAEPIKVLPDVPSFADLGYPKLTEGAPLFSLAGPKDMPQEVVDKLQGALEEALKNEKIIEQLGGEQYVPDEFISGKEVEERLNTAQDLFRPILTE